MEEESLSEDKQEKWMGMRWGEGLGREKGRGNCGRGIKTKNK